MSSFPGTGLISPDVRLPAVTYFLDWTLDYSLRLASFDLNSPSFLYLHRRHVQMAFPGYVNLILLTRGSRPCVLCFGDLKEMRFWGSWAFWPNHHDCICSSEWNYQCQSSEYRLKMQKDSCMVSKRRHWSDIQIKKLDPYWLCYNTNIGV